MSGGYEAFNGHCTFKHKAAGGTDSFVVKLDDGTDFIFSFHLQRPQPAGAAAADLPRLGDSSFTSWEQPRTNSYVAVRTTDGRYHSITYAEPQKCK